MLNSIVCNQIVILPDSKCVCIDEFANFSEPDTQVQIYNNNTILHAFSELNLFRTRDGMITENIK